MREHRLFAWFMHHLGHRLEPAGLRELRRELAEHARGLVLEVGAGDGALVGLYPPRRVRAVVAAEPDGALLRYLRRRAREGPVEVRVVAAEAEALPLPDACVDSVLFSLVLCSVRSPAQALAEAHRVLRPGGQLLLLEHVASSQPGWRRAQQALTPLWSRLAAGCHLDRDPLSAAEQAGFRVEVLRRWGSGMQPVLLCRGEPARRLT